MFCLHIGSDKTGSSSIQWLLRKKAVAGGLGVERLRTPGDWGAISFTRALMRNTPRHETALDVLRGMAQRVSEDPERIWVYTNEILFRKGVADALAEGFAERGDVETKVVCYLRRPDTYAESSYKQRVKNGRADPDPVAYLDTLRPMLDYDGILQEYANAFGRENIVVRPFEREHFPEGDVVLDFLSILGIEARGEDFDLELQRNRSLSRAASELAGIVARLQPEVHGKVLSQLNRDDDPDLRRSRDVYTLAQRRQLMKECASGIERVRKAYTPRLKPFFDTADLAPAVDDPYPSPEDEGALLAAAARATLTALCRATASGAAVPTEAEAEDDVGEEPPRRAARRERRKARAAGN